MSATAALALLLATDPALEEALRYRLEVQLEEVIAQGTPELRTEAVVVRERVREAAGDALDRLAPLVIELTERAGTARTEPAMPRWAALLMVSAPALAVVLLLSLASWRRGRRAMRDARRGLIRARR